MFNEISSKMLNETKNIKKIKAIFPVIAENFRKVRKNVGKSSVSPDTSEICMDNSIKLYKNRFKCGVGCLDTFY